MDGKITDEFYQNKFRQYSEELGKVGNSVKGHNTATTKYFEFGINIFELSQKAKDLFLKAKRLNLIEEQRRLMKLVFTDMKLNEGTLTYKYTPAFSLLSEAVFVTNSSKIGKIEQSGFTIVEILVTIIVSGIVIGAINSILINQVHLSQRNRDLVLANAYVEGKVESLRSVGFKGLVNGSTDITSELPSELSQPRSGTVTVSSFNDSTAKVDIALTYNDQGTNRTYSYTTYVGELGVGQY